MSVWGLGSFQLVICLGFRVQGTGPRVQGSGSADKVLMLSVTTPPMMTRVGEVQSTVYS